MKIAILVIKLQVQKFILILLEINRTAQLAGLWGWRPIALLSIVGKVIEVIVVVERIADAAEANSGNPDEE
jgi:hypothetical protein